MHMEISSKRKLTLQINDSKRHERIWKLFLIAQLRAYYQLISTKAVGVVNLLKLGIGIQKTNIGIGIVYLNRYLNTQYRCTKIIIKKSFKRVKKIIEETNSFFCYWNWVNIFRLYLFQRICLTYNVQNYLKTLKGFQNLKLLVYDNIFTYSMFFAWM